MDEKISWHIGIRWLAINSGIYGVERMNNMYVYTLPDSKTGWERENRTHFDDIVVNYDKVRWDYPSELYADILDYSRTGGKKAVEIGAGTGKATTPMLNAGYDVTAVEMGANMAEFIALPDEDRLALYAEIKEAILRHGGQHKLNCIFQLYMGRKP